MSASTSWEDVYRTQTARIAELERENAALRERVEAWKKEAVEHGAKLHALEHENAALRTELEAQAVVNGKGGEREAKLLAENAALRNEITRLNGQTNWVCSCGGTDCKGRKENEELRKAKEMLEIERCECLRTMDLALNQSAGLRADKERLDWLLTYEGSKWAYNALYTNLMLTRAAIDAARKEAQP